jgi:hypothetical protein
LCEKGLRIECDDAIAIAAALSSRSRFIPSRQQFGGA